MRVMEIVLVIVVCLILTGIAIATAYWGMHLIAMRIEELETPIDIETLLVASAVLSYFVLLAKRKLASALLHKTGAP